MDNFLLQFMTINDSFIKFIKKKFLRCDAWNTENRGSMYNDGLNDHRMETQALFNTLPGSHL